MSRRRVVLAVLGVVLVGAAHLGRSYVPRTRPAVPEAESEAARLFAREDFALALWVPYPHQNLPALERLAGLDREDLEALARLAGLPTPSLPPASGLTLAAGAGDERYAACVEVYPAVAAFSRLAGRLAGNPWLAGGEVEHRGRSAEVVWRRDAWNAASPSLEPAEGPSRAVPPALSDPPALLMLALRRAPEPLPSGLYRLERRGEALELGAGPAVAAAPAPESDLAAAGAFLAIVSGDAGAPERALVFFRPAADGEADLPRAAALYRAGDTRPRLPGEKLLRLAGRRAREGRAAGWRLAALDASSLERAAPLASRLEDDAGGLIHPSWRLWLDLEAGRSEVARIARQLARLPIVPPDEVQRWRDAERLLEPLAERYARLSVTVTDDPSSFRLRLEPRVP